MPLAEVWWSDCRMKVNAGAAMDVRDVPTKQRDNPKPFAYQLVQNEALTDSELSSCKIDYAKLDAEFVGYRHTVTHYPTYHEETSYSAQHATYQVEAAARDAPPVPWNTAQFPKLQGPGCHRCSPYQPGIANHRGFNLTFQVVTPLLIPP